MLSSLFVSTLHQPLIALQILPHSLQMDGLQEPPLSTLSFGLHNPNLQTQNQET